MRRAKRFFSKTQNKIVILLLAMLYVICLGADFFAPYSYKAEDRNKAYHKPQRLHLFHNGKFAGPFVYKTKKIISGRGIVFQDTGQIIKLKIFPREKGLRLFGFDCGEMVYLLGADYKGRDIFSRMLYAGAVSLTISLIGGIIAFLFGSLIGSISGYIGGRTDNLIMRICEIIMLLPGFYLMLAIRGAFPLKTDSRQILIMVVAIMSMIGWAGLARVVRAQVLSIKKQPFVLSSIAIGMPHLKIIVKHIIPHTFSYSIVALAISIPSYILGESALSLIGLGVQEPYASWGNMLSEAMNIASTSQHMWLLWPGVMIFVTVLLYNKLGDGLKDALDIQETI